MLKSDLHLHAGEDKTHILNYSAKELIDKTKSLGFEVLAFTFHQQVFFTKEIQDYAKKKNILLISGCEAKIETKEVLLYNVTQKDVDSIKTFKDLTNLKKKKDILVIAPHPFFPGGKCLGKMLIKNIKLFDAIEYCHMYLPFINFNKKAVKIAKKYNLPLIGTSDAHNLWQLDFTFTLVDSKKDTKAFFKAIKENKLKLVTRPFLLTRLIHRFIRRILRSEER